MASRRDFLKTSALTAAGLTLPVGAEWPSPPPNAALGGPAPSGYLDLHRAPDAVLVQTGSGMERLRSAGGRWEGTGVSVSVNEAGPSMRVTVTAPAGPVQRLHFRWRGDLSAVRLILGDAWERSYGDLEWRGFVPDRVMPWYAATWDGAATHGYGVRTGAAAFCSWQIDPDGISLWADIRSGGVPLQLGERTLVVCDVLSRPGGADETPFDAIHALCVSLCPNPRLPNQPVYGNNDWYQAYGNNSAESVLADARNIVELSPGGANRPFAVIDDGWQPERGSEKETGVGLWNRGNEKFPDMAALAAQVNQIGARPGLWVRPLLAPKDAPDAWRLSRDRTVLDPTVADVQHKIAADIGGAARWGYQLIKHDYSTYDLMGRWGFRMGAQLTDDGWAFAEGRHRTTAEVVNDLYSTIRLAAGDALIIGCNTVSHLSAGKFEMCRIGDDTSGNEWDRVRKYGVNTLAFRGVQNGAFYVADPDCCGVTDQIDWSYNRQWLDLIARSGTMTFVSLAPTALDQAKRRDVRAALALAAVPQPLAQPLTWQANIEPTRWQLTGSERTFDWIGPDGADGV